MTKLNLILLNLLIGLSFFHITQAQVTTTANDVVPEVNDFFRYGVVPGFYPSWGDSRYRPSKYISGQS
jgi:hypothetical protein